MADGNNDSNEPKKGFSGSFLIFLVLAVIIVSLVQSFVNLRTGNVSFSYQLEHLVNLQEIDIEQSRKTAINEKLVTFTGKFREKQTEEGKRRYKFLEQLNRSHELAAERAAQEAHLEELQQNITASADFFLHLTSQKIPREGYVVIDEVYNTPARDNQVVLTDLSSRQVMSLADLQKNLESTKDAPTEQSIKQIGRDVATIVRQFQSPSLGLWKEDLKQELRQVDSTVVEASLREPQAWESLVIYEDALGKLQALAQRLGDKENKVRLAELRTVRDYLETIGKYNDLLIAQEDLSAQLDKTRDSVAQVIWFFNGQELSSRTLEKQDPEVYNHWFQKAAVEWKAFDKNKGSVFKAPDQPINSVLEKTFKSQEPTPNYISYLITALPVIILLVVLYLAFSRQMKGMGSGAMNFGKSPARVLQAGEGKITFADVAGCEEAIEELYEIVDFLKSPQKFTNLGGRIPKGVLCVGPPGTGKTLIARAVAGEADRPFFSISGSDFVEMFVGVGASRIRDLFEQAKKQAPCIVFIDEIDAVGRHRGAGIGGGHDEREQTLNQLLVEMDGFEANDGVILVAATNRPDVLDKALLRPGRFDRRVILDLPDIKGRFQILKVHAKRVKLDQNVDLMAIARGTPGASGADLENILNEAALLAARRGRTAVTNAEAVEARDKVLFGKERRSLQLDEQEKRTTAYHESGHAVVGLLVDHCDDIDKVTIIPRGQSLGATHFLPQKNRVSYWRKELGDQLAVLMGGRAAEEIFLGDTSSGAQQDIQQATDLVRNMVCRWGMSDELGTVAYEERSESGQYLGMATSQQKSYSEQTAQVIDTEVRTLIDGAYKFAKKLLEDNREQTELMAQMLIEFETLDLEDCRKIVIDHTWSSEDKKKKQQVAEELHKQGIVIPPPPPKEEEVAQSTSTDTGAQPEPT